MAFPLLMVTLVREHGLQYLLAATVLTGLLQMMAGAARLGDLPKFVSRPVMTGFVNALAILIFLAQLSEFRGAGLTMYAMVAAGLAIIYGLPRLTKTVPSPLVCIVVLTLVAIGTGLDLRTVGAMGELPSTLPVFLIPQGPAGHARQTGRAGPPARTLTNLVGSTTTTKVRTCRVSVLMFR